ncbi:MAG TPA: hypothetical protein VHU82_14965 [Vicinamibacterales bacterium]|jgi:hypothetical protein|nr:hypothetical protein [Vicinamibacterales bacterium]
MIGLVILLMAAALCVTTIASIVIAWASGKSALWNIGFAALIAVASAAIIILIVILAMRRFSN